MTDHESVCDMGCDKECTLSYCSVCGEDWPCETVQLRATIARVKDLADRCDTETPDSWGVTYVYISRLRAALEGEKS